MRATSPTASCDWSTTCPFLRIVAPEVWKWMPFTKMLPKPVITPVLITVDIPEELLFAEEPPPPHDTVSAAIAAATRNDLSLNILISLIPRPTAQDLPCDLNDY